MRLPLTPFGIGFFFALAVACNGGGGGGGGNNPVPPSISSQPQNATVIQNQTATFSVTANGTAPLTYQWRKGGSALAGAAGSALTMTSAQPGDAGSYDVVVSNSAGTVTSSAATLAVNIPPAISLQPQHQIVLAPAAATFTVTATGTAPLAYQWKRNGTDLTGAIAASYSLPATSGADDGSSYSVTVSNGAGTLASTNAILTVHVAAAVTAQPQNQAVLAPAAATFSVVAAGTAPLAYQWQRNGIAIVGATSPAYTTPATSGADQGALFSVVVSNSYGNATSGAAALTVNLPPAITTQPLAQSVVAPAPATFSVAASGTAPLSYQWKKNAIDIPGAVAASYTTPATSLADTLSVFKVVVTGPYGIATSNDASITVTETPVAPTITVPPSNVTVTAPAAATFTVSASGTPPLSYQWKKGGIAIPGATTASYTTPATSFSDHGAQFTVTVSNALGNAVGGPATLSVNAAPIITVQPANRSVAAPATATFSVTATGTAPLTYQWKKGTTPISGAVAATYTTPATTAGDSGSTFSVTVSNAFGSSPSSSATLTVSTPPVITLQPANQTVLAPATASFSVTATGTAPLSYQWRRNAVNIGGAIASGYTTPATAFTDHGAQYSVVVSNAGGSATSNPATLTVNAAPVISVHPANTTVTAPATATFSVTATGSAPLSFQWKKGGLDIGSANLSSYTTPATVTGDSGSTYSVSVTNSYGSPVSNSATLTVNAPGVLDLTIPTVYITQATQTQAFNVPLVKDRNGYLRAFVVASQANTVTPQVRVRIFDAASTLVQTYTLNAPGASVPTSVNESSLSNSWNVAFPSTYIQPGYKISVDVDPTNAIAETNELNNYWISSTPQALDVRTLNPFRVSFWSVVTGDARAGNVNAGLITGWTALLEKIWPTDNATDRVYGGTFTVTDTLLSDGTGWNSVLSKLNTKRTADGVTNRYYYGVVNPNYSGGVAGMGYVNNNPPFTTSFSAIGWDKSTGYSDSGQYPGVFAHEVGHNFGLSHAPSVSPCGVPSGPDPAYPYTNGLIGVWGLDVAAASLKNPASWYDIMTYCSNVWVSDYNYKKVLASRQVGSVPIIVPAPPSDPATPRSLLLWGRLEDGVPVLEPAFHMPVDALPPEPGDQLLEGFDAAGQRLFSASFSLVEVGCMPQGTAHHFSFSIPLPAAEAARLSELRWTKAGEMLAMRGGTAERSPQAFLAAWEPMTQLLFDGRTRLLWDAATHPMVMVRDKATGLVLGFGEGGDFSFSAEAENLEFHFSDGVRSHSQIVHRPQLGD
jgi:hypothetical protein